MAVDAVTGSVVTAGRAAGRCKAHPVTGHACRRALAAFDLEALGYVQARPWAEPRL